MELRRRNAWKVFILLDICKAYDSVWITGLLFKLLRRGVPLVYVLWIKSWLANRFVYVASGSAKSGMHEVKTGLPQGGVFELSAVASFYR